MTTSTTPATEAEHDRVLRAFARAAEDAGSTVHRLASLREVGDLAHALAGGAPILATSEVAADPVLAAVLGPGLLTTTVAAVAADRPVAVERGVLGVAETGSVLVREPDRTSRLASMLARQLVQVLTVADVVDSLDEVGAWLRDHAADGYAALITGPSRTADIERVLTVGVQGPAVVHVAVVDEWTSAPDRRTDDPA